MPSHASNTPITSHHLNLDQTSVACPAPLTPPPENNSDHGIVERLTQQRPVNVGEDEVSQRPMSDNTAAGMSLMQEESMYTAPEFCEEKMHPEGPDVMMEVDRPEADRSGDETVKIIGDTSKENHANLPEDNDIVDGDTTTVSAEKDMIHDTKPTGNNIGSAPLSPPLESLQQDRTRRSHDTTSTAGVPSIDQELDWSSDLREWDFSRRRLLPQYPSATFQPYSKFKGTQQSDRQIYNVEVTILTVDVEQSTMSGYLQICGLTPDHPTLTTFFTGEIIGGPDQKYSFRTRDPAWGASDKTDLTHWARFPAWRPLSLQAKRNINFVYPLNHENWWQQDCIFMRWKEHFLVPDYKLKSIQGASFEGFYYICFNQVEGRVSGIYFHSKSEKYQQLELKHEGKQGVWGNGGCCSSKPDESDGPQHGRAVAPVPVRHSPQAITSQTAITGASHDNQPSSFAHPSHLSLHHSETSRSALSTPRQSVHNTRSRQHRQLSLADHYNLPIQPLKPWTSNGRTWTRTQLQRERYEFFETRVTGRREIWDGLKTVIQCLREGDVADAQGILDALAVTLPTGRIEEGAYDEHGNLYKLPEAVISDPTDVVEDIADMDSQTVTGPAEGDTLAAKLEAAEGPSMQEVTQNQSNDAEKTKEAKGKANVEKDAIKVRCRLSDRGGPDVIVLLGRSQTVGVLAQRIQDEIEIPSKASIRIAYLGKMLDDKRTLSEQGWNQGHVLNALVVGRFAS